jgi:hypothetical protein
MSDLRDDDDTSSGRITQGGHGRTAGGAVWWLMALLAVMVGLALWWAPSRQVAPAERGTAEVSSVGAGASSRVQTPSGTAPAAADSGSVPGRGGDAAGAGGAASPASPGGTRGGSRP